jgi:hypothetical protein
MAKRWLQRCEEDHVHCKPAADAALPTRLIDIGQAKDHKLRLHLPKLGDRGLYVALSYCWGNANQLKTTSSTLQSHLTEGFDILELPKTIQDAVQVTRELGIPYLWVDALCILQGADDAARSDWIHQSTLMQSVYANSTLTIMAAASYSSEDGIFIPRSSDIAIRARDRTQGRATVTRKEHRDFGKEPANERAWILQERLLSNRVLIYCHDFMIWQCNRATRMDETRSKNPPPGDKGLFLYRLPLSPSQIDWPMICESYSSRKLSHVLDKLPALSGIVREYHSRNPDQYLAGIWLSQLHWSLL